MLPAGSSMVSMDLATHSPAGVGVADAFFRRRVGHAHGDSRVERSTGQRTFLGGRRRVSGPDLLTRNPEGARVYARFDRVERVRPDPETGSRRETGTEGGECVVSPRRPGSGGFGSLAGRCPTGASSSGKTLDFGSSIRRFESSRPSHPFSAGLAYGLDG